jgi:hypothetical protein
MEAILDWIHHALLNAGSQNERFERFKGWKSVQCCKKQLQIQTNGHYVKELNSMPLSFPLRSLQFESNFSSTRAMNLLPPCLRLFTQEREWDAFKK